MTRLTTEQFLYELTLLFEQTRKQNSGSVAITVKNLSAVEKPKSKKSKSKNPGMRKPIDETDGKPACLYRATLGNKKISTVVTLDEMEQFADEYATLLRANMDSLKKKERRRRKKKATSKAE